VLRASLWHCRNVQLVGASLSDGCAAADVAWRVAVWWCRVRPSCCTLSPAIASPLSCWRTTLSKQHAQQHLLGKKLQQQQQQLQQQLQLLQQRSVSCKRPGLVCVVYGSSLSCVLVRLGGSCVVLPSTAGDPSFLQSYLAQPMKSAAHEECGSGVIVVGGSWRVWVCAVCVGLCAAGLVSAAMSAQPG